MNTTINRLGIGSMSLGRPWIHDLPSKLHKAAQHGYQGIELFFDDLDCLATKEHNGSHMAAAQHVRRICDSLNLTIICLQPFGFYEGLLDRAQHEHLVTVKLPLWFDLARALKTDLIQVPANFTPPDPKTGKPTTTANRSLIVSDLQRIADLGLRQSPYPMRFVYEALAWSNHIDTWEASWEVVQLVDRENFGLCLDTFNIAGRVYADPAAVSGKTETADVDMRNSLLRLRCGIKSIVPDLSKIFYVQLVDGERLRAPLDQNHPFHVAGQPKRMNWSRNARLFPFEQDRGGYLPVMEIASAIFHDIGFRGWVSLEMFSRTLAEPGPNTVIEHARRGRVSWDKSVRALGLKDVSPAPESGAGKPPSLNEVQHRL